MKIILDFQSSELPSKYSKKADEKYKYKGNPIVSFPFQIIDVPKNTEFFAMTLIDYDAVPVCGFPWIHWTVANVPSSLTKIPEDFSQNENLYKIQGKNSFCSLLVNETDSKIIHRYIGPTPPDKDHNYSFNVYALKNKLELNEGFYLNELYQEIRESFIEKASIEIIGKQ